MNFFEVFSVEICFHLHKTRELKNVRISVLTKVTGVAVIVVKLKIKVNLSISLIDFSLSHGSLDNGWVNTNFI